MSARPKPPSGLPNPNNLREVLAYNVRLLRVEQGCSQELLAMKCGLDRTYVSSVERMKWNVSLSNIETLAHALGVQAWELLKPPNIDDVSQISYLCNSN